MSVPRTKPFEVDYTSFSGATSQTFINKKYLLSTISASNPDVGQITIGGNDIINSISNTTKML